ncbi:cold-shock protein [Magnetospirillum sp. ME-1]|uniref:cold-shock protein n=1 Tax=Magnetospirillum sp. ME-1 TaxID=1639348 RepID=UPI000A1992CC|nr:cold shock domain-containing protein [Magnetospirillum sp. ME-1]
MAWNRDNHGRGERGRGRRDDFGEPAFDPRPSRPMAPSSFDRQMVSQANVTATVKWFNASKGFGFVAPSDGSPDAFLHISALERAGLTQVAEGATLVVDLGAGQRGPQVVMVHEVDSTTATPRAPRREERGPTQTVEGVVKFFSAEKGFGFVACDEGGKDVFVHVKALERSGIKTLESGQRVRVTTTLGLKGPQADTVAIL